MTRDAFLQQLSRLHSNDSAGLTRLAQEVSQEARESPRVAVHLLREGSLDMSQKAMLILGELEDLALIPIIEAAGLTTTAQVLWSLRTAGGSFVELQQSMLKWIDKLLDDKRVIPARADLGPMEEQPPPARICDEAYLQMRRLLTLEEGKEKYLANARAFAALPEAQKDAEIRKARQSRVWTQLVEE